MSSVGLGSLTGVRGAHEVLLERFNDVKDAKPMLLGFLGQRPFKGSLVNDRPGDFGRSLPLHEEPAGKNQLKDVGIAMVAAPDAGRRARQRGRRAKAGGGAGAGGSAGGRDGRSPACLRPR